MGERAECAQHNRRHNAKSTFEASVFSEADAMGKS
ncbi:hypothetical protein ACVIJ6_002036 [Bradyrhizobium sp. USDA 4369]